MKINGLLLILVLGFALIAYVERAGQLFVAQRARPEVQGEPLLTTHPKEVVGLRIRGARGCIVVRKEGPTTAAADELLDILARARIVRRLAVPSSGVSIYGFVPPQIQISLLRREGTIARSISIGDSTPTGSTVYAVVEGESDVLLVGSYFLRAVDMVLSRVREAAGSSNDFTCHS